MSVHHNVIVQQRPETEVPRRWGLYLIDEERWMDVIFVTAAEAREAAKVLMSISKPHLLPPGR